MIFLNILFFLHNAVIFLFGIFISAVFVGTVLNRKNVIILSLFSLSVGIVFISSYTLFGESFTEKIYPLIVHLPLVVFLKLYCKRKLELCFLSVFTAYLCCQISNWIGIAVMSVYSARWFYYSVRIAVTVLVFVIIVLFFSDIFKQVFQKPTFPVIIISIMPAIYYVFDYITSVYTSLLYSGIDVVVEFLGFVLCISYILFLTLYLKQYEEKCEEQRVNQLVKLQLDQTEKEVDAIKRSQKEIAIIRHDMRHFLTNISSLIQNGEIDRARDYIDEIVNDVDKTSVYKYCKNKIVNMILSSYEERIKSNNIELKYDIDIPENLPFRDVDLTAILSNSIENAVKATLSTKEGERFIDFKLITKENKLLFSLKNTYGKEPLLVDGIPVSDREGHGIGTQSIFYVVKKLKGNCEFFIEDNLFVLRVII